MMKKALMGIVALAAVAAMNVQAGYVVYKATYQPEVYNAKINTKSAKGDKIKFDVYVVFETDSAGLPDDATAPQRIVVIKPNKKLDESATVGENTITAFDEFITETGTTYLKKNPYTGKTGKTLSKLFVDPSYICYDDLSQPTGKAYGYNKSMIVGGWDSTGSSRKKVWLGYESYAGEWTNVEVEQINGVLFVQDYGNSGTGQMWGEYYSGSIKGSEVKSMNGVYSYYVNSDVYSLKESGFSQRNNMKLDKKLTDEVSIATEMMGDFGEGAVQGVTAYLCAKKYASTWTE